MSGLTITHAAGTHCFSRAELREIGVGAPGGGRRCALVDLLAIATTPVEADLIEVSPAAGRPLLVPLQAALRCEAQVVVPWSADDVARLEVPGWTGPAPSPVRHLTLRRFDELVARSTVGP